MTVYKKNSIDRDEDKMSADMATHIEVSAVEDRPKAKVFKSIVSRE